MTSGKPFIDPKLIPLLEKHGLTLGELQKKGRVPAEIVEKRRNLVTELHEAGTPWSVMCKLTGLSLMGIQRLTLAAWNSASRANRAENAARVGRAGRGRKKPWLSESLQADWAKGKFDFHIGRVRSSEEKEAIRLASQRPEVRQRRSESSLCLWQKPDVRERLLAFHRSEEERSRRSRAQVQRMAEDPVKWSKGRGAWVEPKKCSKPKIWTRSSYERIVVGILDNDPDVKSYVFEPRVELPSGRWILPDFVVTHVDGHITLLEVKASWVLNLPEDHKVQKRLYRASSYAASKGWEFLIWTENDFGHYTEKQDQDSLSIR